MLKNPNRTINDEIQDQIDNTIKSLAYPTLTTITHVYPNGYADIESEQYGLIQYVQCIGEATVDNPAVLIFLDNSFNKPIIITHTTLEE